MSAPLAIDIGKTLDDGVFTTMQKCVVLLAALSIVMDGFDGQLIGFAIPVLIKEWGITRSAFAPAVAAGLFADRFGRRWAIIAILRLIAGFGIGGALPLVLATLLDHVTPAMDIYSEESFGPVKGIVRVDGEEAAIACANDNDYGLSSAVFSKDTARALRVAARIESGICHINGATVHDEPQMPFGGVKSSGIGHFGGKAGIEAFTDLRWVTLQTSARPYPF